MAVLTYQSLAVPSLVPPVDNIYDLGEASKRFRNLYIANTVPAAIPFGDTPVGQAFADVAAQGSSPNAARGDHRHGMPTFISGLL